ncbi:hypothetical protein ACFL6S_22705, partial [Candidatus Poribacteria bacterium]
MDNQIQTSDRIEILKRKTQNTHSEKMASQRREVFHRVFNENWLGSQVLRMAKSLAAFLREKDLVVWEEDLLAGYEQYYDYAVPSQPRKDERSAEEAHIIEQVGKGQRMGLFGGGLGGHVIAGYPQTLSTGFGAL